MIVHHIDNTRRPVRYTQLQVLLGGSESKQLSSNLYLERRSQDVLAIRYYETDIMSLTSEDVLTLSTDNHMTKSTKEFINRYLPPGMMVVQQRRQWWVCINQHTPEYESHLFRDGIRFKLAGEIAYFVDCPEDATDYEEHDREMARRLKLLDGYIRKLTVGIAKAALNDMRGDCYECLYTERQLPLGEVTGSHFHLVEHLEDQYYPGHLILASYDLDPQLNGRSTRLALSYDIQTGNIARLRRVVRRYLDRRIIQGLAKGR